MNEENPYTPPEAEVNEATPGAETDAESSTQRDKSTSTPPDDPTQNTLNRRLVAAIVDNFIAMIIAVVAAKSVVEDMLVAQAVIIFVAYLGYYFLFEALLEQTPGKMLTGLVVVQYDGKRCTWRQTFIRTVFRIVEVNPLLLGGLPAALSIVLSRYHQRIGDKVAWTVVVPAHRIRSIR